MTHNSEILIEGDITVVTFEDLLNEERVKELEDLLVRYDDLVCHYGEGGYTDEDEKIVTVYPKDLIMKTFKFEKPVTSIETDGMEPEEVLDFKKELERFFFVQSTSIEIFISRFRTLCDVAVGIKERDNIPIKFSKYYPDLEGFGYGYPLKEVAQYLLKEEKYHLIK